MKHALLTISLLTAFASTARSQRPNVVLVITDDQGYGDLGAHGNTKIRTPNLDALHKESVRLTDYHVDPTCSPTRSALMSGRTVWHLPKRGIRGEQHNPNCPKDLAEQTLAAVFNRAGYDTMRTLSLIHI